MPGKVLSSFGNGFPGAISRSTDDIVISSANFETSADIAFGAPVVYAQNHKGVINWTSTSTSAQLIGFAVRTAKTPDTYGSSTASYAPGEIMDVITRGSVAVTVSSGNPVPGGSVYIVKATGAIVAAADSDNTLELTDCRFRTSKDASGVAELLIRTRHA